MADQEQKVVINPIITFENGMSIVVPQISAIGPIEHAGQGREFGGGFMMQLVAGGTAMALGGRTKEEVERLRAQIIVALWGYYGFDAKAHLTAAAKDLGYENPDDLLDELKDEPPKESKLVV